VHINDSLINIPPVTAADLGIRPTNSALLHLHHLWFFFQIGLTPPADQFQNRTLSTSPTLSAGSRALMIFALAGICRCEARQALSTSLQRPAFFVNGTLFVIRPDPVHGFSEIPLGTPDFSFEAAASSTTNTAARTLPFSRRTIGNPPRPYPSLRFAEELGLR
jgi:hypothetical protein